jgi:ubiquinone/menaquinone biosynthesis C-methylase UbiE
MIHQRARASDFNDLAVDYDRYRIGYSNELFDVFGASGLPRAAAVLDAGCGSGFATEPLVARGMNVTGIDPSPRMLESAKRRAPTATFVEATVEELPFGDRKFDAAVSAQAFHWFDNDRAFAELMRVVKPGGTIGVWWKVLGSDDPLRVLRTAAAKRAGVAPVAERQRAGFSAFYRAPFANRTLRVLPFVARVSVDDWIGYERSRASVRNGYGDRRAAYLEALRAELGAQYGSPAARLEVRYTQYLYIGHCAR